MNSIEINTWLNYVSRSLTIDTTVSSVSSSSGLWCLVNLHVINDKVVGVQTLIK